MEASFPYPGEDRKRWSTSPLGCDEMWNKSWAGRRTIISIRVALPPPCIAGWKVHFGCIGDCMAAGVATCNPSLEEAQD